MADAGWRVTFLSAPIAGKLLAMPDHPRIEVVRVPERPSHVIGRPAYARYLFEAARLAAQARPNLVYASDPIGAPAALLAGAVSGAQLIYHEHDSPTPGSLRPWLRQARKAVALRAGRVIFPNVQRAQLALPELGCVEDKISIVWNFPTLDELPKLSHAHEAALVLYYHGSITPDRLPEAVIHAASRFAGKVRLRLAGYEAAGAKGYLDSLLALGRQTPGVPLVEYLGQVPLRSDLLSEAAKAHVGLVFMPSDSSDINMRHMAGASNKAFDYMGAGLALLVSDLKDWRETFVARGFAIACDPFDVESAQAAFGWYLDHGCEQRVMGLRARKKIEADWNYDAAFQPILSGIDAT
jgi:glycosyltransferase involved in cell wall biosynthesis